MKWTKKMKEAGKKAAVTVTALGMVLTAFPPIPAKAAEEFAGQLTSVESVEKGSKDNIVVVKFNGGVTAQLTFLEDGIFRYNVDPPVPLSFPFPPGRSGLSLQRSVLPDHALSQLLPLSPDSSDRT